MLERLRRVSEAATPATHLPNNSVNAGHMAEYGVATCLISSRAAFGDLRVWHSLRVPSGGQGRQEIDVVLLTEKGLYTLEIKNWSGRVTVLSTGEWLQTRRNGSVVHHGAVLAKLLVSAATQLHVDLVQFSVHAQDYLRTQHGLVLLACRRRKQPCTNTYCPLVATYHKLLDILECS